MKFLEGVGLWDEEQLITLLSDMCPDTVIFSLMPSWTLLYQRLTRWHHSSSQRYKCLVAVWTTVFYLSLNKKCTFSVFCLAKCYEAFFIIFGSTVGPDVLRPLLISTKVIYLSRFVCSSFVLWAESLEKLYVIFYEIDGWCKFWEKKLFILWWSIATIYVLGILLTLWVTLSGRRDDVEVLKLASHTECMHTWLTDDFLFSAVKYHQHTHTISLLLGAWFVWVDGGLHFRSAF